MSTQPGYAGSDSEPETRADAPTAQFPAAQPARSSDPSEAPTEAKSSPSLLTAASSDRCNNCGAQLASDQRYCVVCGERRGRARFASAMFAAAPEPAAEPAPAAAGYGGRTSRYPPGATLVAGVVTLLVAMALGILIGHDSNSKSSSATPPHYTFNVNAGGSGLGSGSSDSGASSGSSGRSSGKGKGGKVAKSPAKKVTPAAAAKASAAASKVLGSSSVKSVAPTTQVGGACSTGQAGCHGGKFNGAFFGG